MNLELQLEVQVPSRPRAPGPGPSEARNQAPSPAAPPRGRAGLGTVASWAWLWRGPGPGPSGSNKLLFWPGVDYPCIPVVGGSRMIRRTIDPTHIQSLLKFKFLGIQRTSGILTPPTSRTLKVYQSIYKYMMVYTRYTGIYLNIPSANWGAIISD